MTHWYITTGRSLSTDSRCWKLFDDRRQDTLADRDFQPLGIVREDGNLWAFLAAVDASRAELLGSLPADRDQTLKSARELVAASFREECWTDAPRRHALPAELATLAVLRRNEKIQEGDTLTLILGESNLTDGRVLQAILEHLAGQGGPLAGITVQAIGPFELDPKESDAFNRHFKTLTEGLPIDGEARFVLTGGYKAVLIALARWLAQSHPSVPIFSLHESGNEVIEIRSDNTGFTIVASTRDEMTAI